jgi:uncharacterized protein YxeA
MKKVVVLLLGIIIGILAGLFFLQSLAAKANAKLANPFGKATAVEIKESASAKPSCPAINWSNILLADFVH